MQADTDKLESRFFAPLYAFINIFLHILRTEDRTTQSSDLVLLGACTSFPSLFQAILVAKNATHHSTPLVSSLKATTVCHRRRGGLTKFKKLLSAILQP